MQSLMAANRLGYSPLAKLSYGERANLDLSKRGADLSRGPNARGKLPAAAWSNTWPAPAATLDLDFANNRGFVRGYGSGGSMDAVTFTRASNGNWVDQNGLLRTGAGTFPGTANATALNVQPAPQNFENATWTKTNLTVTANVAVAPDGTNTAYLLKGFGGGGNATLTGTVGIVTSGKTVTATIYVKAGDLQYFQFATNNISDGYANFDVLNGVAGTFTGTFSSPTATDVGNGWFRLSVKLTGIFGTTVLYDLITSNTATRAPAYTGTAGLYIWGSQLEVGSSATTYYPTNINAPRFDWASTTPNANQVNQLTFTEQFDSWISANETISANTLLTTDPLGGNTADAIYETATASVSHSIYNPTTSVTINIYYTYSVYVKANGRTKISIGGVSTSWGARFCNFDLTAITATPSTGSTGTITSVGNGWYRVSWTTYAESTQSGVPARQIIYILDDAGNATYTGDVTKGIFLWGAQMELGVSVTAYQAISQPTTNIPLVANSTCNGLLIEESRTNRLLWCRDGTNGGTAVGTNLCLYSEQFDNGFWSKTGLNGFGSGSVANTTATTDPLGGNTADYIQEDTSAGVHRVERLTFGFNASNFYTVSIYAKAAQRSWLRVHGVGTGSGAYFDLANGVLGSVTAGATASITNVGNGWYRCSFTISAVATANLFYGMTTGDGVVTYTGDGVSGLYIWGAQVISGSILTDYQSITGTAISQAWSRSNVTVAKNSTGIDGVANAATTITATANNAILTQPITIGLAAASRTSSVYLKRVTGTGNVQVTMDGGATWSTVDLSNGLWNRIVLSYTVINVSVGILIATSGDAVAMDYAQVEDGAFATSAIFTTTATVTRSAEAVSLAPDRSRGIFKTNRMSVAIRSTPAALPTTANIFICGDGNNYVQLYNTTAARLGMSQRANGSAYTDSNGLDPAFSNLSTVVGASWGSNLTRVSSVGTSDVRPNSQVPNISSQAGITTLVGNNFTTSRIVFCPDELNVFALRNLVASI